MHPVLNHVAPHHYLLPPCICLWQISQIQTCLCVGVGPGFVSTSPAFMRSSASHPAAMHGRLAPKNGKSGPLMGPRGFDTICTAVCNRCDSSTACRLCRLEHIYTNTMEMTNISYSVIEKSCNKLLVENNFWKSIILTSLLDGTYIINLTEDNIDGLHNLVYIDPF